MIVMKDVGVSFQDRKTRRDVLKNLHGSFEQNSGIIGILGQKKSGKTTLLNLFAGNVSPESGQFIREGSVSWVLSSRRALVPTMNVRSNIRFVAMIYGVSVHDLIRDVCNLGELHDMLDARVNTLPRDMQARFVYCLSLCLRFDYYLADETLIIGDPSFRKKMADYLSATASERTVILVSRSPAAVRLYCKRAYVLHEGRLHSYKEPAEAIKAFKVIDEARQG